MIDAAERARLSWGRIYCLGCHNYCNAGVVRIKQQQDFRQDRKNVHFETSQVSNTCLNGMYEFVLPLFAACSLPDPVSNFDSYETKVAVFSIRTSIYTHGDTAHSIW